MTDELIVPSSEIVRGWRGFNYAKYLYGGYNKLWEDKECQAACLTGNHSAPHESCTCGIYYLNDRDEVYSHFPFIASVVLWGKIIEHQLGGRAEYARIERIFPRSARAARSAGAIEKKYGIPVEWEAKPRRPVKKVDIAALHLAIKQRESSPMVEAHIKDAISFLQERNVHPTGYYVGLVLGRRNGLLTSREAAVYKRLVKVQRRDECMESCCYIPL